jgi:hypothetical protein
MNKSISKQLISMILLPVYLSFAGGQSVCFANDDQKPVLKGGVTETISPFKTDGSTSNIVEGTKVAVTLTTFVNSEISKIGDDVVGMVALDIKDKDNVVLPGRWFVHGKVSDIASQRRLGRDGYVEIKFDKLISPDGKIEVPFETTVTTKDSWSKTIAKTAAIDSYYMSKGAVGGALLSVQMTGIPGAIATHGYSVAIGAAAGASLGLIGALHRKGKITGCALGEEMNFKILKPVVVPAFNPDALPSASKPQKIEKFSIFVDNIEFKKDPFGDKRSRLLKVKFKMENRTNKEYSFANVVVMSDHNHLYYPYVFASTHAERSKKVGANSCEAATITFGVDSPKHKYWLVLLDKGNHEELTRVPIN